MTPYEKFSESMSKLQNKFLIALGRGDGDTMQAIQAEMDKITAITTGYYDTLVRERVEKEFDVKCRFTYEELIEMCDALDPNICTKGSIEVVQDMIDELRDDQDIIMTDNRIWYLRTKLLELDKLTLNSVNKTKDKHESMALFFDTIPFDEWKTMYPPVKDMLMLILKNIEAQMQD